MNLIMLSDFHDLSVAKTLMCEIAEKLPAHSPYKADFDFFSAINYTTQSEYRQELKSFLETIVSGTAILTMPDPVKEAYPQIVKLYGWL